MKRCPECRRDYYDDTLLYCLDDGAALLDGPRSSEQATELFPAERRVQRTDIDAGQNDMATAILPSGTAPTVALGRRRRMFAVIASVTLLAGIGAYFYATQSIGRPESANVKVPTPAVKLYWEMSDEEKSAFIADSAKHVQQLIGDEPIELESAAVIAIKKEVDDYVEEKDSLSQKPFEEGLRVIYGRASQYAPLVAETFESHRLPAALGVYQAMIESEYHDCPEHPHPTGPVGLFQFSRKTAAKYDLKPEDYCNIEKQSDAAARHMSDLISDFGSEKSSWTLALLSFNIGAEGVREYMRAMRSRGVTERNYWALLRDRKAADPAADEGGLAYVPRFFAAAIIGENPTAFDLSTPPLTTLRR